MLGMLVVHFSILVFHFFRIIAIGSSHVSELKGVDTLSQEFSCNCDSDSLIYLRHKAAVQILSASSSLIHIFHSTKNLYFGCRSILSPQPRPKVVLPENCQPVFMNRRPWILMKVVGIRPIEICFTLNLVNSISYVS